MSFVLNKQIFDKVHHIWVDGIEIADQNTNYATVEMTAESSDIVDKKFNTIKTIWRMAHFSIITESKNAIITIDDINNVDENKHQHLLCCTGMGWRSRPHKNRRIKKKWEKKYGTIYGYCSVNIIINGKLEIFD